MRIFPASIRILDRSADSEEYASPCPRTELVSRSNRVDGSSFVIFENPAVGVLHELQTTPYVRFSLLAVSSIFFLVDPFAAIPSFLAITAGVDPARRSR